MPFSPHARDIEFGESTSHSTSTASPGRFSSSSSSSSSKFSISTTAIIGIVICLVILVVCVAVFGSIIVKKRRTKKKLDKMVKKGTKSFEEQVAQSSLRREWGSSGRLYTRPWGAEQGHRQSDSVESVTRPFLDSMQQQPISGEHVVGGGLRGKKVELVMSFSPPRTQTNPYQGV